MIIDLVQMAMGWLDALSHDAQLALLETLTNVTEGKIFVEVEGARLTRKHAHMLEADGKLDAAAKLLQEVQVETCGAMERREKAEYILDQMRLVLLRADFVRTQIISRKINPKLLESEDFQDVKLQYYEYMIKLNLHEKKWLDVSKCYHSMYGTSVVQAEDASWRANLEQYVLYLLLASYDNEQNDLLHKVKVAERKKLEKVDWLHALVEQFLTVELIAWPLPNEAQLRAHCVFTDSPYVGGEERWQRLRKRVTQHNLKVVETYYARVELPHLAQMLQLGVPELELELSEFVCSKFLYARVDRPSGIVTFGKKPTAEEKLNDYANSVTELLALVENSCHLIAKEEMVHAARKKASAKAKGKKK